VVVELLRGLELKPWSVRAARALLASGLSTEAQLESGLGGSLNAAVWLFPERVPVLLPKIAPDAQTLELAAMAGATELVRICLDRGVPARGPAGVQAACLKDEAEKSPLGEVRWWRLRRATPLRARV
jgi:hypothetical protein